MTESTSRRLIPIFLASLALLFGLAAGPAQAKGFLPVLDDLPSDDVVVYTRGGERIEGEIRGHSRSTRGYTKLRIHTADGVRYNLKVTEIDRVVVPVFGPGLSEYAVDSVREASTTDWETLTETREVVWDSLTAPWHKKPTLYQRLNPGFDTRIQVYGLPGRETEGFGFSSGAGDGPRLLGGLPRAYLVVREGSEPIKVTRMRYDDVFEQLFADCPAVAERFGKGERGFRQFADHVYFFEVSCR